MVYGRNGVPQDIDPADPAAAGGGDLLLWQLSLAISPDQLARRWAWLSPPERERANRYRVEAVTRRFVACRAATRVILGDLLGLRPDVVRLEIDAQGKPHLAEGQNPRRFRFNLSHSGDVALLAVGVDQEVGIDVEQIRSITALDGLLARCLAPRERDDVAACPAEQRVQRFLRYWTHKEAYLKTYGHGLRVPLNQVVVDLEATPGRRVASQGPAEPGQPDVSVCELGMEKDLVAAVAWASRAERRLVWHTCPTER
jgi:4'-phosphopantetheinyl transferase